MKCPVCGSARIRKGYRPTPFWSKLIMRFNLLCDNCNWEFAGFAIPGTIQAKPTRKPKESKTASSYSGKIKDAGEESPSIVAKTVSDAREEESPESAKTIEKERTRVRRKIKLKGFSQS